jgi:CubicO group peptidase (beta-lactamase class C family)
MPGTVFNYSDTGYILLGLLIEKVTEIIRTKPGE